MIFNITVIMGNSQHKYHKEKEGISEMKERYEALEMEVIAFREEDIIRTSGGDIDDEEWD